MSEKAKNITLYSAKDIQKYLNGELSAPDMHALEKAALEDPFLADAMDGMAGLHAAPGITTFEQDMAELRGRLDNRISPKEKDREVAIPITGSEGNNQSWWKHTGVRIAASLFLLLGLGAIGYYSLLNNSGSRQPLAVTQNRTAPAAGPTPAAQPAAPTSSPPPSAAKPRLTGTEKVSKQVATTETPHQTDARASLPVMQEDLVSADTVSRQSLVAANAPAAGALPQPIFFTGKVTDLNNNPLAGASLRLAGRQGYMTTTDTNGSFSLKVPSKDASLDLKVDYIGYEEESLALNQENTTGNIIRLKPQANSLNEVVVTGFGAKRKAMFRKVSQYTHRDTLTMKAIPVSGWEAYQDYLLVNQKILTLDSTLRGEETISFLVGKQGMLSSFRVEQSLSPAHDKALIRLIRKGPAWKLRYGDKERAEVTLVF